MKRFFAGLLWIMIVIVFFIGFVTVGNYVLP
jgi:hypothetical protein